jgi:hypothetical protein
MTSTYAGLMAASNAIVSKYAKRRMPSFTRVPPGFELPTVQDMHRILRPSLDGQEDLEQKVARVTACAIFHALEATRDDKDAYDFKPRGYAGRLASDAEAQQLQHGSKAVREALTSAIATTLDTGSTPVSKGLALELQVCRYCGVFQELMHPKPVPIEVLNHAARINSDFNPETNISEAGIVDFQLLVPQKTATRALEQSHPLLWEKTAEKMFEKSRPAETSPSERPFVQWHPAEQFDINAWSEKAFSSEKAIGYLYERAKHPWNEQITAVIDNVFRITDFANVTVDASTIATKSSPGTIKDHVRQVARRLRKGGPGHGRPKCNPISAQRPPQIATEKASLLSYGYELESCIESNFGLGLRNGGLDVDDGRFDGSAIHYTQISPQLVEHLQRSDFLHLAVGLLRRYPNAQSPMNLLQLVLKVFPEEGDETSPETKRILVMNIGVVLTELWNGQEPWLLTVSASKRLRYSYPRDGQSDLWSLLTWMAPAFLFTFINRSVCQLPHLLELGL